MSAKIALRYSSILPVVVVVVIVIEVGVENLHQVMITYESESQKIGSHVTNHPKQNSDYVI